MFARLALLAALAAGPALAGESLGGKQLPLPPGPWRLAAETTQEGLGRPVLRRLYVQVVDGRLAGFALAATNAAPGRAGWGLSADCLRQDIHFAAIAYRTELDGACAFVNHASVRRRDLDGWLQPLQGFADSWPSTWLMAGVRVTDRHDFVDIRYYFSPAVFGLRQGRTASWAASSWMPERVHGAAEREAVLAGLSQWAMAALEAAEQGMRNRLGGEPLPAPRPAAAPPEGGAAAAAWAIDKSLVKTVTWRIVGTMGDLFTGFALTGNAALSGGLAALGALVNSTLYFGHELVWEQDASALLDVPGLGDTGG